MCRQIVHSSPTCNTIHYTYCTCIVYMYIIRMKLASFSIQAFNSFIVYLHGMCNQFLSESFEDQQFFFFCKTRKATLATLLKNYFFLVWFFFQTPRKTFIPEWSFWLFLHFQWNPIYYMIIFSNRYFFLLTKLCHLFVYIFWYEF